MRWGKLRQNRIWRALVCAALLCSLTVAAYAHSATAEDTGENRYKSVRLTPEVYQNASAELSDLRLYDALGEQVPYFIRSGNTVEWAEARTYPMEVLRAYPQDDAFLFDLQAVQTDALTDVEATSLVLSTDSGPFAKEVVLLGSADGTHWREVCRDTVYRVENQEKLEIVFPAPQKYTFYRVSLSNNLEEISLSEASLRYSAKEGGERAFIEAITPAYTVEQKERQTLITLTGIKNLRLAGLHLEADGMFLRRVSTPLAEKELYQLNFSSVAYRDLYLPLGGAPWREDTLQITVENGDNKPVTLGRVVVEYYADELVFEGGNGPYRLQFGEPLEVPSYDIESYRAQVLAQPIDALALSPVMLETPAQAQEESPVDWQLVFNGVTVAVAVLLGIIIITRIRKNDAK